MNPTDAETIFEAARRLDGADKQAQYLELACGNDPELRKKIDSMLAAHHEAEEYFQIEGFAKPTREGEYPPTQLQPVAETAGTSIGRYKLLQKIGEGGMGIVFMAEQIEPVRRKVALKIIKLGMDTKSVVARFEAERQALALMDHPNIAKVLDAGSTDTGRPYFVMELVKGVPINTYCDKNQLRTKERLELFAKVCKSIQHAHQKGVIHRDIKPSNILVTLHDGNPVPKVIDFGIAKATNQRLTEKTLFTNFAQMIGTPAYMSPEQAEMSGLDVDTRTDVYSLGVLLYELLTGTTPFPEKELLSKGYGEMQRIIAEQQPDRPSLRMSTLVGEQQTIVARSRSGNVPSLAKQLRGDLDWIVMKALEKDRTRRYETANGLAEDIHRHLADDPVSAVRPSLGYQLTKTIQRNKPAFAAGLAIAAMLILSTVISTVSAIRAQRAKDATQSLNDFVFRKLIGLANPETTTKRSLTLLDALDQIDESISDNFADRPELEIEALLALGRAYLFRFDLERSVKYLDRAYQLSRQTYGDADLRTLVAGRTLLYSWLPGRETLLPEHYETTIPRLYQQATTLFGPDNPNHYMCHMLESWRLSRINQRDEAMKLLMETESIHDEIREIDPVQAALNRYSIGLLHKRSEDFNAATHYYQSALSEFTTYAGDNFPLALLTRTRLAGAHMGNRRMSEAIAEYQTTIADGKDIFTSAQFMTQTVKNLLTLYYLEGENDKAEALAREVQTESMAEQQEFSVERFLADKDYLVASFLPYPEAMASGAWERALDSNKAYAESGQEQFWFMRLAECHQMLGNYDEAYETLAGIETSDRKTFRLIERARNRAQVGDWEQARTDAEAAIRFPIPDGADLWSSSYNKHPARALLGLINLRENNLEGWVDACAQLVDGMRSPSWPAALESAFTCLGQSERLPSELERRVIDSVEIAYQTPKSNPRSRTNQILLGALVARTKGNFQGALDWLDEWPFRTTPPKSKYYLKVMLEHSQHLLIANCHAHLNQIEQAKENLQQGDNLLAQDPQTWWAPVVLAGLRAETEALIATAK